ncbi:MAG: hypothetical protein ACRDVK_01865 [Acidimicrobiia bacterium]
MASEHFYHRARASNNAERVWAALQKLSTWKKIGGVDRLSDERFDENGDLLAYRFMIIVAGSEFHGAAMRKVAVRQERMVMEIDSSQVTGEIAVRLEPDGEATWVGLSLSMASQGLFSAMLFPMIVKAVAGGFEAAAAEFINSLDY